LEIPAPDHSKVLVQVCSRVTTPERCPSLVNSQGSTEGEFTDTNQLEDKLCNHLKGSLESAYSEICSFKQLIEEQRLALNEYKNLLSDVENTAAELTY